MKKALKRMTVLILAAVMVMAMSIPAFAGTTTLSNARFVRESGEELRLGMGTILIDSGNSTIDDDGNIVVKLKSATITFLGTEYGGKVTGAHYIGSDGKAEKDNLVSDGYLYLDNERSETMPANGEGIHLELDLSMNPLPPGMKNQMRVYFTCDNIQ